ncbi:unnamed protein product [Ranitomeya imitator]|uniref:Uncharacterized protein n=1 Tax=Ranitomeya imitator TaxID=111125 RepID=A0ABN9KQ88_9NEOB|nr:unnamed protein product [Ranitomeya imitator]
MKQSRVLYTAGHRQREADPITCEEFSTEVFSKSLFCVDFVEPRDQSSSEVSSRALGDIRADVAIKEGCRRTHHSVGCAPGGLLWISPDRSLPTTHLPSSCTEGKKLVRLHCEQEC